MKHTKKRLTIIVLLSLILISAAHSRWSASWYAGNKRTNAYGVKATIRTPLSEPYLEAEGISSWVSLPQTTWLQAGWRFFKGISGGKPLQYIEFRDKYGAQGLIHYQSQNWNTAATYQVSHRDGEIWCAYINGIQKLCKTVRPAPVEVQAYSEVHASMFNELEARYTAVYYRTSDGLWFLFDQEKWREDFPYKVQKDYKYAYRNYRSITMDCYLPLIFSSP